MEERELFRKRCEEIIAEMDKTYEDYFLDYALFCKQKRELEKEYAQRMETLTSEERRKYEDQIKLQTSIVKASGDLLAILFQSDINFLTCKSQLGAL
ncbi:hypothetical protein FJZ17_02655 [Candidatus Pacearchaeota archaeon]|nr:hypothetical protein [Candidatus Pacearchaeota archaeon]